MPSSRRISISRRSRIFDHDRGEAERELVDQQQLGPADDGARERQHLPLAAGQQPADAGLELAEPGKELVDQRFAPPVLRMRRPARHRRDEVLRHGEVGKHLVALGHQHDAAPRILVRRPVFDARPLEADRAFGHTRVVEAEEARDRPQRRALAGAVRPQQRDDLPRLDRERDALHRGDGPLVDHFELLDRQQRAGHQRDPDAERCLNGHSRK